MLLRAKQVQMTHTMKFLNIALILVTIFSVNNGVDVKENDISAQSKESGLFNAPFSFASGLRRRCPVCDSSVCTYCGDRLFHDSCCCHNPNNPYDQVPYQCRFADCSFLHANSCAEHKLITACCCISNECEYRPY